MKQIPLSGKYGTGKFTLVDDAEYDYLMQWKWLCNKNGYAVRTAYIGWNEKTGYRDSRQIFMHREINKTPEKLLTDHVDGDKLNNQRHNLRTATPLNNVWNNPKMSKKTSSEYKGVSWHEARNNWRSRIRYDGKEISLGSFPPDQEKEAAMAYNEAAIKYHGEFACLNKI
jgi:hypothetical protein